MGTGDALLVLRNFRKGAMSLLGVAVVLICGMQARRREGQLARATSSSARKRACDTVRSVTVLPHVPMSNALAASFAFSNVARERYGYGS